MAARWDSGRAGAYLTARATPGARQTWCQRSSSDSVDAGSRAQRNWERPGCEHYCDYLCRRDQVQLKSSDLLREAWCADTYL